MTKSEINLRLRESDCPELRKLSNKALSCVFNHNLDRIFDEGQAQTLDEKMFLTIMENILSLLGISQSDKKTMLLVYDCIKEKYFDTNDTVI